MTVLVPDYGVDPSVVTVVAALLVGSPQHDVLVVDNQNKLALPEISNQMTLSKW